jgi:transcription elongation GreA/GreB family factor
MADRPNYITPAGYRALREEYEALYGGERPKLLETISWAAANGDRSENATINMAASGCARWTGGSTSWRGG